MFSKFSRIGAEPVKWQFTVHITKLSLPSLKSACVVVSRGDSKVSTPYTEPVKGYFTYPEPLTIICTLYRKRDKGGNGVYLPKEGEVRILERGKAKEAGVVAIDFTQYVSESRSEVESADNNWRIEKTADKYNNFMIVTIAAKRLGPGGAEEAGGATETAVRKEEVKEADEEEEEDEVDEEEREWKKRNTLPAGKGKQSKWKDEEDEDEEEADMDEDDSPKKKKTAPPAAAAKSKPKSAAAHHDDDDDEEDEEDEEQWSEAEDDIIKRLKGLKAEGKLAPVSKPAATAGKGGVKAEEKQGGAALKAKPAGVKKDKSQMTAKELLFADSDEEEEVKPKRGAAGKAAAAVASKAAAGKEEKAKGGAKAAGGNGNASRPTKALNWEVVIPTATSASSSPHSATSASASTASAALPPAKPIPANRLFSCTLAEANTVYPSSIKSPPAVPHILTFLLQQLDKCHAFLTPSLFKQYVDPSHITALRTQLEQGNWKLKGAHSDDPHVLGGVLKQWVSGLQDGLVGEALVGEVLDVGMMEGEEDDDVAAAVKRVSARLSPLHRASLLTLLHFLHTMTLPLNVRKNGMKAESIASAWGAAIVRMKADPKKSAYDQFSDKANVNRFVQYCMQHIEAVKAASGVGAGPSGVGAGGKAVVPVRQMEEEEAEDEEENGGEEEDEVLKEDEEDVVGEEEEAAHDDSDGEVAGLKFHHDRDEDEEEEEKSKGKSKPLTARERLDQERQEREKQKAEKEKAEKLKVEREKAEKDKAEKERADKLKADKEKLERERKEREEKDRKERERKDKERKEKEEKERKEKERKEKDEKDKKEREEREKKEKLAAGKKVAGTSAAAFKPANVFGDSDLDDEEDEAEQPHDEDDDNEQNGEEEEAVDDEEEEEEEEVKTMQPKGSKPDSRPTSPAVVTTTAINANSSSRADRELISRQQTELDSLRKQLADTQSNKPSTTNKLANSSSADDITELKTKLITALKEKDAAVKEKREADRKLTLLESERESQKKMIDKLQKMLVAKGKVDVGQLSELNDGSRGRASPAPPPPPPAAGAGAHKLSEHLSVLQLKYDAVVEEMEQKLSNEKQIRKQLKQQLEQLTEENSNLRQRSMHFDQLVQANLTPATLHSPTAATQGSKKTRDELLAIVAQQYERISFLEHTMRENEGMMRQAKQAWTDSARIMEDEMAHKDDELTRMREGYEAAVQEKGVEWVGEEEWRKRVERLKRDKERCEREKKEMEDEVRGKRVELQEAMKTVVQLEDDTRLLKEELTRTGIALKTIAEDNFELKEWMRLHSKGKKG